MWSFVYIKFYLKEKTNKQAHKQKTQIHLSALIAVYKLFLYLFEPLMCVLLWINNGFGTFQYM